MLKIATYFNYYQKTTRHIMSRLQAYPIEYGEDKLKFCFVSIGFAGEIVKLVSYDYYRSSLWNLSFGDANDDQTDFDYKVISDNGDMRKVMQTVFQTSLIFTDEYPNRKIYIEPVDRKRRVLYNRILQEKQTDIEQYFTIEGGFSNKIGNEPYNPLKMYDTFVVTRKV